MYLNFFQPPIYIVGFCKTQIKPLFKFLTYNLNIFCTSHMATTPFLQDMDSLNHSSPPITFLCPRLHSHPLSTYGSELYEEFFEYITDSCDVCNRKINHLTDFWCQECMRAYHKKCVECPPERKVPYHPKHPLQLHFPSPKSTLQVGSSHYNKCNCCGENTHEGLYYSCSICDFYLHPVCAISLNILSINYPKRHDHTLTYFPRINSLTCDVCALSDDKCFIYVCYINAISQSTTGVSTYQSQSEYPVMITVSLSFYFIILIRIGLVEFVAKELTKIMDDTLV